MEMMMFCFEYWGLIHLLSMIGFNHDGLQSVLVPVTAHYPDSVVRMILLIWDDMASRAHLSVPVSGTFDRYYNLTALRHWCGAFALSLPCSCTAHKSIGWLFLVKQWNMAYLRHIHSVMNTTRTSCKYARIRNQNTVSVNYDMPVHVPGDLASESFFVLNFISCVWLYFQLSVWLNCIAFEGMKECKSPELV